MTRVVVAASSPAARAGLGAILGGHPGLTVLETAGTSGLRELAETVEADVILLALERGEPLPLPLALPPDAAGREPAVVVLGDEATARWAQRAIRGGARGALPRTATGDQIAAAVAAAAAGLLVLPAPDSAPLARPALHAAGPAPTLTPREAEVLAMLAEGLANRAIAARLGISEHTVKTHLGALFAKLGVDSRTEAVASAARLGLVML